MKQREKRWNDPWLRKCQNIAASLRQRKKHHARSTKPPRKIVPKTWEEAVARARRLMMNKERRLLAHARNPWLKKMETIVSNLNRRKRARAAEALSS
jgi:hypothetical protein